jgi:hypothetical protein
MYWQWYVVFTQGTRVYIFLSYNHTNEVEGLCGNFDGITKNDLIAPVSANEQEFGGAWKIDNSCPNVEVTTEQRSCPVSYFKITHTKYDWEKYISMQYYKSSREASFK